MKRICLSLLLVVFILGKSSYAQEFRSFSMNHDEFKEQLYNFFTTYDKKWAKQQTEAFNLVFDTEFSVTQRDQTIRVANVLYAKRLRPFPDFINYLETVKNFVKKHPLDFNTWVDVLETEGKGWRGAELKKFLSASNDLIVHNSLKNSNSFQWKYKGGSFKFYLKDIDGEKVPHVDLGDIELILQDKYDTSRVSNTSGSFDMLEHKFHGTGGVVNWERVGLNQDSIYAEITRYTLNVNKPELNADSVTLYSKYYVDRPLLGHLEEKLSANHSGNSKYPAFDSYEKRVAIKRVAEGVSFSGGFSVGGKMFSGFGDQDFKAIIEFSKDGQRVLKAESYNFAISDDHIDASQANISLYVADDSIVHPQLALRFNISDRSVSLKRGTQGIDKAPFVNTLHGVDMHFDEMQWDMDSDSLLLSNNKRGAQKAAVFESINFFSLERYTAMQGMDVRHPLYELKKMSDSYGSRDFYVFDVTHQMKMREGPAINMLMNMAISGFLTFDLETGKVHLNNRMFDFLDAREEKRDYDKIQFVSSTKKTNNALISLLNYDMHINGVSKLQLSDSRNVFIYPYGQELTLKKNRDFYFDGKIVAGRFEFYGQGHSFSYDTFNISMPQVDSMRFYVPEQHKTYEEGEPVPLVAVKTVLRDMTGVLEIDGSDNKSGLEELEQYPRFQSGSRTYAFYDKAQNGAYSKDEFFFQVEPFLIESLDDFETKDLEFSGTMNSAGIFGDFAEGLKVQEDYSLGFVKKTGPEGISMYEGKGTFMNDITLSNSGLQGGGELDYLTVKAISDTFYFTPDSTIGVAKTFTVQEQLGLVEHPKASANAVDILWMPKADKMIATTTAAPMAVFRQEAKLEGAITVSPDGAIAQGDLRFLDARSKSNKFDLKHNSFRSESASVDMQEFELGFWGVSISDAKTSVDFTDRVGVFQLNNDDDKLEFTSNQYSCYMDNVQWKMNDGILDISQGASTNAPLVSTNSSQDGLMFKAGRARYTLSEYLLEAYEVDHIDVGDARLFIPEKYVSIGKEANMARFTGATISADTASLQHEIYDVEVKIKGRLNIEGKGVYDYVAADGDRQSINLDQLLIGSDKRFVGTGTVEQSSDFALSPQFDFYGDVSLYSVDRYLHMSGQTKLNQSCKRIETAWIPFKSVINPGNIQIDLAYVDEVLGVDSILTGVAMDHATKELYVLLLATKHKVADVLITKAKGFIAYDIETKTFRVSSKARLKDETSVDASWILDESTCTITAEGPIDLGNKTGQVQMSQYGVLNYNLNSGKLTTDVFMMLDFFFDGSAIEFMHGKIMEEPLLQAANYTKSTTKKAIQHYLGKKEAEQVLEDLYQYGELKKTPNAFKQTMVLPNVSLKWVKEEKSWVSEGSIGISNLGEQGVNRKLNGSIVLEKKDTEDELYLFFKATLQNYYFFNYRRNLMESLSSWPEYTEMLRDIDPKKRKMKTSANESAYSFGPLNVIRRLDSFLDRY
jgi:hypothetical protein